jgi:TonB family protein
MKFYKLFVLIAILGILLSGLFCGKKEIQRSREDFIYLSFNVFVFEASQAEEKLEFTPFPTIVSTHVIDQIFKDAEEYFEALKSLSIFNRFLLLTSATQKMKLLKDTPLKIEALRKSSSTAESGYEVEITPQEVMHKEVQLRVAVKKGGKLFFTTDVSAPMNKSVVIGRMMEKTKKAVMVSFSVEEEKDSSAMMSLDIAKSASIPELTKPVIMDSKPVALEEYTHPAYPESARKERLEGTVWLRVLVDEKGDVVEAVVIKSLRKDFDQAALGNAWKIKYAPAVSQGKVVPVWLVYSVTFKLK